MDEIDLYFNGNKLNEQEQKTVKSIVYRLFEELSKQYPWALDRCTFFTDRGYDILLKITNEYPKVKNPRIEGCDYNPFDQHYWLAFDLVNNSEERTIIVDSVFGYIGLENMAEEKLSSTHLRYYKEKRHVPRGGVRVKTIGI